MAEVARPGARPDYRDRVTASMLWAAWADAVGFISELTDESGLRRRTDGRPLDTSMDWKRRVGGQYGVQASLPAGTYSDDTQLRLAVTRSISEHGFDVEAFARIELPVWPAYALGGGRASRAAAAGMAKATATWHTNFYDGWTKAGGNGAAMRIQPHVWAGGLDDTYIVPVLRDVVVTHGHPRAIVGAVLHAVALAFSLRQRHAPAVSDWASLVNATHRAVRFFSDDRDLANIWVPAWEREEQRSFEQAWGETVDEVAELLTAGDRFVTEIHRDGADSVEAYRRMVEKMGLTDKRTLGSGTASVTAAMAVAAAYPNRPAEATVLVANAVGTDTDTIATITAAMVAAGAPAALPGPVQDEQYLRQEAARLASIAEHEPTRSFAYPDTLKWRPPQSQLDAVGTAAGGLVLAGLAWLEPLDVPLTSKDAGWSWMRTSIGMTVLVKHRLEPRPLPAGNLPSLRTTPEGAVRRAPDGTYETLFDDDEPATPEPEAELEPAPQPPAPVSASLDTVFQRLIDDGADDARVGNALREVARHGTRDQFAVLTGQLWALLREQ
ncbi:ADP-ribosylglycohydrolase family protein [Microbacterium sp. CFBP 8790]|uniref:ADP-ribosylglycohydrolase family protein n=1 Tax=unclassified Microbacterium TaxID=2609290 RepID=UPI00177EFCC2|nr:MULTISPECIES: ADP-ribosylglycohydrolase family protein [unclassified Microbacterium]MBD8206732.1 ADP-ribosylglycohydrolase family protein [Microbacterium sp. CFBP 8801]MBD8509151.1 ADP-ribosylglycohydrolase family protein [Microbacterium sp. CFBP 8790]